MPDSIGVPSFDEGLDVDALHEGEGNEMTPEEIKEVDAKFQELYPDVHEIALKSFSEKMGVVDLVCPRAVVGGSQEIFMTPSLYGYNVENDDMKSANLRYIFPEGLLTSEQRKAIDDIARNYNPNREKRPTI
ncbi:MAG TPA: hypothetical protein PKW94_01180 [Candidatus Dojkabacteria bacterium]|jgi:hypothetical protein|nr:hypothetical protein [Candidatus Dojkabacteria bacterium]HOF79155.1 hypothetical protein [Candidatus Dojkabacteria bacterium]HOR06240.1 hypothetical protein [Candidatus Dojkabacteria bacterium]HOT60901.1 hypothetical protein [Candidatus Dojkabacteria bacterium]HQI92490.1 hypothetical protein [Candidatus Dojkabacteria bacterium]